MPPIFVNRLENWSKQQDMHKVLVDSKNCFLSFLSHYTSMELQKRLPGATIFLLQFHTSIAWKKGEKIIEYERKFKVWVWKNCKNCKAAFNIVLIYSLPSLPSSSPQSWWCECRACPSASSSQEGAPDKESSSQSGHRQTGRKTRQMCLQMFDQSHF